MTRKLSDQDCDIIVQKLIERLASHLARSDVAAVKKDVSVSASVPKQMEAHSPAPSDRNGHYVRKGELLKVLWGPESRPSQRWLAHMMKRRAIPFIKVGGSVFYDPVEVKNALKRFEIRSRF